MSAATLTPDIAHESWVESTDLKDLRCECRHVSLETTVRCEQEAVLRASIRHRNDGNPSMSVFLVCERCALGWKDQADAVGDGIVFGFL